MDLVSRAKQILMDPKSEWQVIKSEEATVGSLFTQYAVILAAIPPIAGLIGNSFMLHLGMNFAIQTAVVQYVVNLLGVYVMAFIIDILAPNFGSNKDMVASLKVVVYAYTASWVGGILMIVPAIGWLGSLAGGIYSLYLLYLGLQSVKNTPQDKLMTYTVVSIIAAIVVSMVIGGIVAAVIIRQAFFM